MYLVGLTGGIGTGKSTISNFFIQLDVPIIDADLIARKVVEPRKKAWNGIRHVFGDEVLESDGQLNRRKLASLIFDDPSKRKQLNQITHPEIAKEIAWQIIKYLFKGYQFVIIDSPLLFEANTWARFVQKVIVVSCDENLQLERLMNRDKFTESEAKSRMAAQMPMEEKCRRADFVIENSKNLKHAEEQVNEIWKKLKSSRTQWRIRIPLILITISVIVISYYLITPWIS